MDGLVGVVCDLKCSFIVQGIDTTYILVFWGLMDGYKMLPFCSQHIAAGVIN